MRNLVAILAELSDGEERRLPPTRTVEQKWRYFHHAFNNNYDRTLMQKCDTLGEKQPTPAIRGISYQPLSELAPGPLRFSGGHDELVDYYKWGGMAILISDRFHTVLRAIDPEGIESHPYSVVMPDGSERSFWAAMAARVLDAIDLDATEFVVRRRPLYTGSAEFISVADFDSGCVFRDEVTNGVASFVDFHGRQWVWSDEVIEAAAATCVRGFYAKAPCQVKAAPERIRL